MNAPLSMTNENCDIVENQKIDISQYIKWSFPLRISLVNVIKTEVLILFRMGLFGVQKGLLYLKSVTHILQWWNEAHLNLT